jgi:hypothetical protein
MGAWFRRGDGAEFEVSETSEAYSLLVAQGAVRIPGPDAPSEPTSAPTDPSYGSMKVDALRALLTSRELETTGNKAELVARLEAADAAAAEPTEESTGATDGADEDAPTE